MFPGDDTQLLNMCHTPKKDWYPSNFAARGIPGNEFAFGAGAVNLERGLVYEDCVSNFRRYVEGDKEIFGLNLPTFAASFPHTYRYCEKTFTRLLKKDGGAYNCVIQYLTSHQVTRLRSLQNLIIWNSNPGRSRNLF